MSTQQAETEVAETISRDEFWRSLRARHPGLRDAVLADARMTAFHRGERSEFRSAADAALQLLRLAWVSDAFLAQVLYRFKARLQALRVPIVPRLAHRLAMALAQVSIGDPVVVHPGVYIIHGQLVADGLVEIHSGVVIAPFVTIGLRAGDVRGATIEHGASIGTGAKVIGPVRIGAGAQVGANAVVVDDVPPGATVVGAPARPISGDKTARV
jgi:serine O-acetyltransferase